MDDPDDGPDPNPPNFNSNRFPQSSSSRPKPPIRSPFAPSVLRPYAQDVENDEDDDEKDPRLPLEDEDEDDEDDDEDDKIEDAVNGNEEQESSEESRGKRRRLDRFEFAPRVPPPVPAALPLMPVAAPKNSRAFARNPLADWTEDETFVLLEAWGDRYVQNGRKSLRSDEWNEVAKKVCESSRIKRSDAQCRNRVDTLKKKYKKELAKLSENQNSASGWIYFKKMDTLMTVPLPPPQATVVHQQVFQHHQQQQLQNQTQPQQPPPRLPGGVDAGEYTFNNSRIYGRANDNDETRDSPGESGSEDDGDDDNEDESDGLPPRRENFTRGSDSSFKMLADSIQKFGEIYEKMEINKRQQMAELERMRKEFQRDLEVQSRQILERAQAEIAKLREEGGEDDEDDDDDNDDDDGDDNDGSAENLSGFLAGSVYLTVFAG